MGGLRGRAPWWPVPTAWGAGLIAAALGAAAITLPGAAPALRGVGAALVLVGIAALAWGVAILARGRFVAARSAIAGSLMGMLGVVALLALNPARTGLYAAAACIALLVVTALGAATATRRGGRAVKPPMWGLIGAAAVIALVATPALGSAQDAALVRDDGTVVVVPDHH